jgi:hypothetical protein
LICRLAECRVEFVSQRKNQLFCNKKHQLLHAQRKVRDSLDKKVCEGCQKDYQPSDKRQRFCSRSCSATATNPLKAIPRFCKRCKEKLIGSELEFCSRRCYNLNTRDAYISDWKAGKNNGSRSDGSTSNFVRNYLLEQANFRCTSPECAVPGGWSVPNPTTGKPILALDHIDGNWKNNAVDNLIILCYNCHTLTPTFGSLNKNSPGGRSVGKRMIQAPIV